MRMSYTLLVLLSCSILVHSLAVCGIKPQDIAIKGRHIGTKMFSGYPVGRGQKDV